MSTNEKTKVKDHSNDNKYFVITPRLVWALCVDPYEYTFWCIVKDIAGEDGECYLTRDDMATLTMMSGGKASECRDTLIGKKLLNGDFRQDPGYPQPVWHLSIPDFWEANVRWSRQYSTIKSRVDFKREQQLFKKPSPGDEKKEASRGDKGGSSGDRGVSPGDLKKNVLKKNQQEEISINDASHLFTHIIETLKPTITKNALVFLSSTTPVSLEGGVLTLAADTDATRDWLDDRLRMSIDNALPGIFPEQSIQVRFVVLEEVTA